MVGDLNNSSDLNTPPGSPWLQEQGGGHGHSVEDISDLALFTGLYTKRIELMI